jgi:hypothetical protein
MGRCKSLTCQACSNKIRPQDHRQMYRGYLIHNSIKCKGKIDIKFVVVVNKIG